MSVMSAIALFGIIWFLVLFVVLPIRLETQGEAGDVEPGTPSSAPSDARMVQKFKLVTAITVVLWAAAAAVLISGVLTLESIDFFGDWRRSYGT